MSLDFNSAAILIWMPTGETPSIEAYQVEDGKVPETVGCWSLGVALIMATKGPHRASHDAWIKVGNVLLGPDRHERLYEAFKNGRDFVA